MAKAGEPILVPAVLKKQADGAALTLREAQAVARATGELRNRFYNDLFMAMQNPNALDPGELECIAGVGTLLFEYGFLSPKEAADIQKGFEMLG